MNYKDAIKKSMGELAKNKKTIFIGYSVRHGCANGTLKDIPDNVKIETPVAENLMIGLGMGMSLEGFRPIIFFERFDFVLNAMDGIVNHLDKIDEISGKKFQYPLIIRVEVGSRTPLMSGVTHIQNYTKSLKQMVKFPILTPKTPKEIIASYKIASKTKTPIMIIEQRDFYNKI